jgi:hypothetical protein
VWSTQEVGVVNPSVAHYFDYTHVILILLLSRSISPRLDWTIFFPNSLQYTLPCEQKQIRDTIHNGRPSFGCHCH